VAKDILDCVEILKKTGVKRILSSGGEKTASDGQDILNKMIKLAAPDMTVIVAGKVTWENFAEISERIPSAEYHGRRLVPF